MIIQEQAEELRKRDLNLARQRMHVGKQPRLRENHRVEFLCRRIRFGLVENAGQIRQTAGQYRNRKIVH